MKAPLKSKDGLYTWWAEDPPAYVVPSEVLAEMEGGETKIVGSNMRRRSYTSEAAALEALAAAERKIQARRRNPAHPLILE